MHLLTLPPSTPQTLVSSGLSVQSVDPSHFPHFPPFPRPRLFPCPTTCARPCPTPPLQRERSFSPLSLQKMQNLSGRVRYNPSRRQKRRRLTEEAEVSRPPREELEGWYFVPASSVSSPPGSRLRPSLSYLSLFSLPSRPQLK